MTDQRISTEEAERIIERRVGTVGPHDPRIWERPNADPAGLRPPDPPPIGGRQARAVYPPPHEPPPAPPPRYRALSALEALARAIVALRETLLTEDEAYRAGYRDGRRDARDFGPSE